MGVGEEEWGSSERDVLEDFARRTEGLIDVMVSRFGEASSLQQAKTSTDPKLLEVSEDEPWLGSGKSANAADGVVFSGLGDITRKSRRDLSQWVESIYGFGEHAYGVRENPTAGRKRRKRNLKSAAEEPAQKAPTSTQRAKSPLPRSNSSSVLPPGIPPPIVKAAEKSLDKASAAVDNAETGKDDAALEAKPMLASLGDTETWVKYMTLGYGTAWGGKRAVDEPATTASANVASDREPSPAAMRYIEPEPDIDHAEEKMKLQIRLENDGYFLVGLKGDLRDVDVENEDDEGNWNTRIPLRTIHLETESRASPAQTPSIDSDETPQNEKELDFREAAPVKLSRLRPVVYVVCLRYSLRGLLILTCRSIVLLYILSSSSFGRIHSAWPTSTATSTTSSPLSTAHSTGQHLRRKSLQDSSLPPLRTQLLLPIPPRRAPNPSTILSLIHAPILCTPASPISLIRAPLLLKA